MKMQMNYVEKDADWRPFVFMLIEKLQSVLSIIRGYSRANSDFTLKDS